MINPLIYRIENGEVLAVLPEFGRVRLTLDEWIGEQSGVQLLAVTPGRDAQQRKLGFSWFRLSSASIAAV